MLILGRHLLAISMKAGLVIVLLLNHYPSIGDVRRLIERMQLENKKQSTIAAYFSA
jgi:hypothetical protein